MDNIIINIIQIRKFGHRAVPLLVNTAFGLQIKPKNFQSQHLTFLLFSYSQINPRSFLI